ALPIYKGKATKEVWYYEMPYPEGISNFSRSRPIDIKHFNNIKTWWTNREENEYAWKVSLTEIKERNFNLDIKNPHIEEKEHEYSSAELLEMLNQSFKKSEKILKEIKDAIA